MKIRSLLLPLLVSGCACASMGHAAVLAHYFTGISRDIANHASPCEGVVVGSMNKGNGSWWNAIGGNTYPNLGDGNQWFQMPSKQTSIKTPNGANADLSTANGWISFSFQAENSSQTLVLDNLTFDWAWAVGARASAADVGCFLYYRTSSAGEWLATDQSITKTPPNKTNTYSGYGNVTFDLDQLTGIGDYVEFAMLFTDGIDGDSNQTHLVGNLIVNGDVAIPEPATAVLGLVGFTCLLMKRRRRFTA